MQDPHLKRLKALYHDLPVKFTKELDINGKVFYVCRPADDLFFEKLYNIKWLMRCQKK